MKTTHANKDMEELRHCLWECQLLLPFGKLAVSAKTEIHVQQDACTFPLLGTYPTEMHSPVDQNRGKRMFWQHCCSQPQRVFILPVMLGERLGKGGVNSDWKGATRAAPKEWSCSVSWCRYFYGRFYCMKISYLDFSSIHACVLSRCSHVWLCATRSPPGSSVQGIRQSRIPEWVAVPSLQGIFPT